MGSKEVRCCLLLLPLTFLVGQTLDTRIFEQCYGSLWKNYLTASCDAGQVISVLSLKAFAKRRDTKCPQEETAQTPLPSDSCCRHSDSDCGDIYNGVSRQNLRSSCDGRQDCIGIPIAWMDTPCNTGEYLNKTNYMRMEYVCIPSTVIAKLPNNILINGTAVYIQNDKYPDGNTFPPGTTMTCLVKASIETPIVVTAIYLKFLQLQVASGVCGQRVTIEDGKDGTNLKEISCESNTYYNITEVYRSASHFIKFTVFSNILSNRDWRFWFEFKGVETDSRITLACGSQTINSTHNTSPGIPTPVSTNPSLRTTTALQTTPTTATPNSDGQNDDNGQNDGILLIAILVPLAVIIITVTVVIIVCCKKNISDACCNGQGAIHPSLSEIGDKVVGEDTEERRLKIDFKIKERKKEDKMRKKVKKLESKLRFLKKQKRMNETSRFRVAGYAARAFHPPVMRPYYQGSGQQNYYIPDHNMYDQQLPFTGNIYGYPTGQNLNFQNTPPADVQSSSTSTSTDGNYKNAYVTPASLRRHPPAMSVSQSASESPLIFHTGQFGSQFVPQGSIYEPYENPALRQWRVAGMAATFANHPQVGRHSVEIGSVDNPNESESSQSYDDSIV